MFIIRIFQSYWDGMLCQWEGGVQATIGSQFGCSSAS